MVKKTNREKCKAMTLVEVIGVLAIIAILTSLLLPRIQKTIGNKSAGVKSTVSTAQINGVLFNLQAIKAATMQHHARFGSLASRNGSPLVVSGSYDHYDAVLLSEGLLDKPFAINMGGRQQIRLINVSSLSAASAIDGSNGAYDLRRTGRNDIIGASFLVEAVIEGASRPDASALNDSLDGSSQGGSEGNDLVGQVVVFPRSGDLADVHIYIAHY